MMPLYGNPGDYAWGRGGFDAIVTQLLNQMDGTGPPPMSTDDIKLIPTIKVNQTQVGEFQRRHIQSRLGKTGSLGPLSRVMFCCNKLCFCQNDLPHWRIILAKASGLKSIDY